MSPKESVAQRSCDACQRRKVRCDRGTPCSNCRSNGLACRTTKAAPVEPRSRVIITKEYEKKIDRMENRLERIETLLQQGLGIARSSNGESSADSHAALPSRAPTVHTIEEEAAATPVVNPVSQSSTPEVTGPTASTHFGAASKQLELHLGDHLQEIDESELGAAFRTLKSLVDGAARTAASTDTVEISWVSENVGKLRQPGLADIEKVLLVIEGRGSLALTFTPGLTTLTLRNKYLALVDGHVEMVPWIQRLHLYAILWHLCNEVDTAYPDPSWTATCKSMCKFFFAVVGEAVNNLGLIVPIGADAAAALILAADIAINSCKLRVAHTLSAKAASMVLILGYNRPSSMQNDTESVRFSKTLLFWMANWLDCSFSVSLGHYPIIRSCDIAVTPLEYGAGLPDSFVDAFNYSSTISRLQCKVVAELYSPAASQKSAVERRRCAPHLISEIETAWKRRGQNSHETKSKVDKDEVYHFFLESDRVRHYSTLTLVLQATRTNQMSSPAIEPARQALSNGIDIRETYRHLPDAIWGGYCQWAVLQAPITPFTVVFCEIIANPHAAGQDLRLLQKYTNLLGELQGFSEGLTKIHRLCDIFCKVAVLYVRTKTTDATGIYTDDDGVMPSQDIDRYLASVGFASSGQGLLSDAEILDEWYQGHTTLMEFLDQDIMM